ncbi:MAG: metallophosphoesterase [Kiritimatiellae bacterium]|nr:metallophosphoesterase [Kiritimatiellia bacterium]MDD5523146.1 metallophosphoesterase [Kiritimatiellia bacterium]
MSGKIISCNPTQITHSFHRVRWFVVICTVVLVWARYNVAADLFLDPAPEGTFSIIVIPDTQGYRGTGTKAQPKSTNELTNVAFDTQTRWIADNLRSQRVVFVSHVGDIVDKNVAEQWALARRYMDRIHGLVPYGIAPGNHDMAGDGNTTLFQAQFGAVRFTDQPWYAGTFTGSDNPAISGNNANSCQLFSIGGLDFVILHLECNVPDNVLQWAGAMLNKYASRRAIVTTHMDLGPLDTPRTNAEFMTAPRGHMRWSKRNGTRGNSPQQLWDKFFRKSPNLFMIFSGDQSRLEAMHLVSQNDAGKSVHELMSDYGSGYWLRVYRFIPSRNIVKVFTVDTRDGRHCTGTKRNPDPATHEFEIECNLGAVAVAP